MKTIIAVLIISLIAFAASCDSCQDRKAKPNLYLKEVTHNNDYYLFKEFKDRDSREMYDTICIMCEFDTTFMREYPLELSDYRAVWRLEHNTAEDRITGTVMHLEKIKVDCKKCPDGKKSIWELILDIGKKNLNN